MAYDIPPPLEHKEKIMFGLTFEQLAYAMPAFFLVFAIIFKSGWRIELSGAAATLVIVLACYFMFFSGRDHLTNLIKHIRFRKTEVNRELMKKIIDIDTIEDDVIVLDEGKLSIVEITPINLLIQPDDEQQSIVSVFQKFLNSLDFHVQIHISSEPIDLKNHLEELEKIYRGKKDLFESYQTFIAETIDKNNTLNRRFYLIVHEKYDLEIQTEICMQKLSNTGVKTRRLKTNELVDFLVYYIAGNRVDIENNKEGIIKNYLKYLVSPKDIDFYRNYYTIGDEFYKVLAVRGYPQAVELGFLDKIISSTDNYDISLHVEPFPIDYTMIQLNRDLQKQQSDLYSDKKKGIINPSLEIKYKSTRAILEELQKGNQKLFNVSLYILCKGKTLKEVELLAQRVKTDLDGLMIQNHQPSLQMIDAYTSILPLGKDALKTVRNVHTHGLSAFYPFSSPFLDLDTEGVLLGLNRNNIPYIKNIFGLTNANGIVLATSGAGKSYFTKLFISRQYMNDTDIIIIDPQGEYPAITQHYGGEVITISRDSDTMINPLDLMGHDYVEKRLSLMDIFQIMFGDLTEVQKAILDKAIEATYSAKSITRAGWLDRKPPVLEDLYNVLIELEKGCSPVERTTYRALLNRLGMYTSTGVFSFLNRQTNIDFSKDFVCFNIGNMPKQVKPVVMYLILDYVYMRMKESKRKKILVIDEAWSLLRNSEESSYVFEIVKTCRKFNLGLLMITQDVADLVSSSAGQAVLSNTSYSFLLRQKPATLRAMNVAFNLSDSEKEFLVSAERGKGILILENEHQEISVVASKEEDELITTNPNQKGDVQRNVPELQDMTICLNTEQDVYDVHGLKPHERNFLKNNGYVAGRFQSLEMGDPKMYMIKERPPEGAQHTYYVDLIYREIKKRGVDVKKYFTEKPDLIFKNKHGWTIAIEVETGLRINRKDRKRYRAEKFARVSEEYGQNAYVFLIKSAYKKSYEKYGLPILLRKDIKDFVEQHLGGFGQGINGRKSHREKSLKRKKTA